MTYTELRDRQQKEVNALPIYWAFGDDQWRKLLNELGLTEDNYKEHLIGYLGGIVRKTDAPMITETLKRHHDEMSTAMQDIEFFKQAVLYEMRNHEYGINLQGDYDVINALGYNVRYSDGRELAECNMSDQQKKAYREVKSKYYEQYGDDF